MRENMVELVREMIGKMLGFLGEKAEVDVRQEGSGIKATIKTDEASDLLKQGGEGIDAFQNLLQKMAGNMGDGVGEARIPVRIDIAGFRDEREMVITQIALDAARTAKRSGNAIVLNPMNSWERRVVHVALREMEGIHTESVDEEMGRAVRIIPDGAVPGDASEESYEEAPGEGPSQGAES